MLNLQHVRNRLGLNFEPFVIRLSDGRAFEVPHRDFIAVGRGVVVVLGEDDISHKIDALHIVSLDDPAPQQSSNGS